VFQLPKGTNEPHLAATGASTKSGDVPAVVLNKETRMSSGSVF
jgi:hypothetical protein